MKIFVPLSDEQLEQLTGQEIPMPYQPGCVTLAQLERAQQRTQPARPLSPDPAPAHRPAARRVAALFPR